MTTRIKSRHGVRAVFAAGAAALMLAGAAPLVLGPTRVIPPQPPHRRLSIAFGSPSAASGGPTRPTRSRPAIRQRSSPGSRQPRSPRSM